MRVLNTAQLIQTGCIEVCNPVIRHDVFKHTPPRNLNVEPEKKSLEKEIPSGNHHFQVPS